MPPCNISQFTLYRQVRWFATWMVLWSCTRHVEFQVKWNSVYTCGPWWLRALCVSWIEKQMVGPRGVTVSLKLTLSLPNRRWSPLHGTGSSVAPNALPVCYAHNSIWPKTPASAARFDFHTVVQGALHTCNTTDTPSPLFCFFVFKSLDEAKPLMPHQFKAPPDHIYCDISMRISRRHADNELFMYLMGDIHLGKGASHKLLARYLNFIHR